jgi:carboxyl-terminal processing protease
MDNKLKIPLLIILFTAGIVLGIQLEKILSGDKMQDELQKLNEVLSYTEKYYLEDVDTLKLVDAAINGIMDELDPHSFYIPSDDFTSIEESFRGDFEGIGIEFQVVNDTLTVVAPISGGPSESLGILPGDRILKIEGEYCIGITNEEVRQKLRGKAGTKVKISVLRSGVQNLIEYEIIRDKIPIYSVDVKLMLDEKTGYVSVSRFAENTLDELQAALIELKESGMKQLILDLRGNPGGYLSQAVDIADLFIDGKKKIVYTKGRREDTNEEFFASVPSAYESIPLIILINDGSASASEIVAGAVQDWDRGLIVGETSFGKGLVQRQFTLSDNSAIRLTISEYYTPSGRLIQRDYKNKKNIEEYYNGITDNENDAQNINHEVEKDSTKVIYKTEGGRNVFGGGGITPDFIIKTESLSDFTSELLRNNIFYQYTLNFIGSQGSSLINLYGNDLKKFNSDFNFSESELSKFAAFAQSKGVIFNYADFRTDLEYIAARLKAQLARNYWKNEGWYTVILSVDNQLKEALNLFDEAKELANLK